MTHKNLQEEIGNLAAEEFARESQLVALIQKIADRLDALEARLATLEARPSA